MSSQAGSEQTLGITSTVISALSFTLALFSLLVHHWERKRRYDHDLAIHALETKVTGLTERLEEQTRLQALERKCVDQLQVKLRSDSCHVRYPCQACRDAGALGIQIVPPPHPTAQHVFGEDKANGRPAPYTVAETAADVCEPVVEPEDSKVEVKSTVDEKAQEPPQQQRRREARRVDDDDSSFMEDEKHDDLYKAQTHASFSVLQATRHTLGYRE